MTQFGKIQLRRGTATQWYDANPILLSGEIGYITDTGDIKIGDGTSHWNALPYFDGVTVWGAIQGTPAYILAIAAATTAAQARAAINAAAPEDIQTAVNNLVNGAGSALDTLKELADALGGDANFATTVATNLALKSWALIPTAVKSGAYTAAANDLIPADATAGGFTVTLPDAPADRTRIAVKKIDSGTNVVTIARNGSGTDVFNKSGGSTSLTLVLPNQSVMLQYAASPKIWYVVGDDLPLSQLDARYITTALTALGAVTPAANKVARFTSGTAADLLDYSTDTTLGGASPSDTKLSSQKAIKTYIDLLLITSKTTSYTLAATDAGTVLEYNSASPGTFTLNTGVLVYGNVVGFRSVSTGQLTIAAGAGVTINSVGGKLKLTGQWSEASLHARATAETFILSGDLSA